MHSLMPASIASLGRTGELDQHDMGGLSELGVVLVLQSSGSWLGRAKGVPVYTASLNASCRKPGPPSPVLLSRIAAAVVHRLIKSVVGGIVAAILSWQCLGGLCGVGGLSEIRWGLAAPYWTMLSSWLAWVAIWAQKSRLAWAPGRVSMGTPNLFNQSVLIHSIFFGGGQGLWS